MRYLLSGVLLKLAFSNPASKISPIKMNIFYGKRINFFVDMAKVSSVLRISAADWIIKTVIQKTYLLHVLTLPHRACFEDGTYHIK